jgi:hypothetical protein
METLSTVLSAKPHENKIDVLGQYAKQYVDANWDVLIIEKKDKFEHAFATVGEPAYGTYLHALLQPIHNQLEPAGLRASSRLPGHMEISREWGLNPEETEQYRCIWSTIYETSTDNAIGTLVTVLPHDHTAFRIPVKPDIFALEETAKEDVVIVLSEQFREFNFSDLFEFQAYHSQRKTKQ